MKKKIILVAAIFIIALLFAACKKESVSDITIVLDWLPNTNHTGVYAASSLGYFADEGLNVNIIQPPEDGALLLTASGVAQFCFEYQESLGPALANQSDAMPLIAVAAVINHNTSGFMSLKESGIKSARDMENKRFASLETSFSDAIVKNIVEGDGGDFSKVSMISNNAIDAFSALRTEVDLYWSFYAWDGVNAEINNIDINFIDLAKTNPLFDWYTPILIANSNFAKTNPATVKKFMRAVSRGYQYAIEHSDDAAEILVKNVPELESKIISASQKYLASRYQGDAPRWGEIDSSRWRNFYKWMFAQGLLNRDLGSETSDQDTGFTNEFLP
ncbi:nitrate ABC transporter substrate-binding protein [Spirochaetia bacterium]|nr:nitrate ABC transporter substrate-binding protein [Spirochaetia bacterium]